MGFPIGGGGAELSSWFKEGEGGGESNNDLTHVVKRRKRKTEA